MREFPYKQMGNICRLCCLLVFLSVASIAKSQTAEDTLRLNEPLNRDRYLENNYFVGVHASASYNMSEYVREQNFFTMLGPGVGVEFGKSLNKWLAGRVSLEYTHQVSSTPYEIKSQYAGYSKYTFNMASGVVDAMVNLTSLFGGYRPHSLVQLWLFGGGGADYTFGFTKKLQDLHDYNIYTRSYFYVGWRAGLESHWRIDDMTSIQFRYSINGTNKFFSGQSSWFTHQAFYSQIALGVIVKLPQKKYDTKFEYYNNNYNYYYEEMNHRLNELHAKYNIVGVAENDSLLLFPQDDAYITESQQVKLKKLAKTLKSRPNARAEIVLYADKRHDEISSKLHLAMRKARLEKFLQEKLQVPASQVNISTNGGISPYPSQHIWHVGGAIRVR